MITRNEVIIMKKLVEYNKTNKREVKQFMFDQINRHLDKPEVIRTDQTLSLLELNEIMNRELKEHNLYHLIMDLKSKVERVNNLHLYDLEIDNTFNMLSFTLKYLTKWSTFVADHSLGNISYDYAGVKLSKGQMYTEHNNEEILSVIKKNSELIKEILEETERILLVLNSSIYNNNFRVLKANEIYYELSNLLYFTLSYSKFGKKSLLETNFPVYIPTNSFIKHKLHNVKTYADENAVEIAKRIPLQIEDLSDFYKQRVRK